MPRRSKLDRKEYFKFEAMRTVLYLFILYAAVAVLFKDNPNISIYWDVTILMTVCSLAALVLTFVLDDSR